MSVCRLDKDIEQMGYRIRKVDKNQPAIVKRFRDHGCTVCILSSVGNGIPDILISKVINRAKGLYPWSALVEIKDGSKPPSARKLTPDEQAFHDKWQGEIYVISTLEEVDALINSL